jgi:hypothetical protein
MANIFSNAVKFLGNTLKQVATNDNLRDFQHATRLFLDGNYRLNPKNNFLFYVYFDVNNSVASPYISQKNSVTEIGMLVKQADLPKFNVETKVFNSYNRPNVVQSKLRFDPLSIVFHDDNANVVRNFWYDYYNYYYRDSDYDYATYGIDHKYQPQLNGKFGYTKRQENQRPYLRSIRIYSLHQKAFSEYILVNPIIKSFRHGQHVNGGDSGIMQHDMVVEYETALYSDGYVTIDNPIGFATLHYDTTPSPLRQVGGVKSIFGTGGLLDTAGSVLSDVQQGNWLSAAFKAARGINTAKGMNLKKAAISELTNIYTQQASNAIVGAINNTMRPGYTGYNVPTVGGISGVVSNRYTGIQDTSSVVALAGAALLLNSTPLTNRNQRAANVPTVNNHNPQLPNNTGTTRPAGQSSTLTIANDSTNQQTGTNQQQNLTERKNTLDRLITGSQRRVDNLNSDLVTAKQQFDTANAQVSNLNTRLSAVQATTPPSGVNVAEWTANKLSVIADLKYQIEQTTVIRNLADRAVFGTTQLIRDEDLVLEGYRRERGRLQ